MKEQETVKKKKWPKVLLVILIIIALLAGFITFNASKNMKVMNRTLDSGMDTISRYATVTSVDAGDFSQIKIYGLMKFNVSQYEIKDLGNLSVMTVNMGFMQMVSYVITPYEKNMPLLSMDFMYIMGKRKAYAEFYDLVPDKTTPEYAGVIDAVKEYTGVDFSQVKTTEEAKALADQHNVEYEARHTRGDILFCSAGMISDSVLKASNYLNGQFLEHLLDYISEYSDGVVIPVDGGFAAYSGV